MSALNLPSMSRSRPHLLRWDWLGFFFGCVSLVFGERPVSMRTTPGSTGQIDGL